MRLTKSIPIGLAVLSLFCLGNRRVEAAETPPHIASLSAPEVGSLQILFHGTTGPFMIQMRESLNATSPWIDIPGALVTELQPGVYMGLVPAPKTLTDLGFYRVISEAEGGMELDGWTILLRTSTPANGQYFVPGESPSVTATILDTRAQGLTSTAFSTLSLYMHGPEDPLKTTTPAKLLNVTTNRSSSPHHYVDLKKNTSVKVEGNSITYKLQAVSNEEPGTYTLTLSSVLASDPRQQLMKFAKIQIGSATVEAPLVTKTQCASCHEGPMSGKMYMHHVDPGRSPTGSWALDYQPVTSCKACHSNEGYAAYTDASGAKIPDPIVRRVHGVHMGAELKLPFNTNSTTGDFRDYTHVEFPADIRDCTSCHVDNRWKTAPSRLACGTCHDNSWFGPKPAPEGWAAHSGGPQPTDLNCTLCHIPDAQPDWFIHSIAENHAVPDPFVGAPPMMDLVDVSLTPPANGKFYVAGEKPVVTLVIRDDAGKPIDHTKVTDANFSTASLFVYGPRAKAVPVLTSAAKNGNSKLRASVSSSIAGPWAINGKTFKISVNGSAPQDIKITGASSLVTAAEVVASLNAVVTNLNAKATVSGANVNIRTTIQGDQARFEIYNGEVTTTMGWKRAPNTVMEPDVTIAAGSTQGNDLRVLSDPLDYMDPLVTRNGANITYQLDDIAGLAPGTYGIYVYHLPKAGKVSGLNAATGIGFLTFQVGTATAEKKIATNCADCHSDNIFHLSGGPIHAEPFDTDYCVACHDYGKTSIGEMFKNQGGTSLNGWSGYGAMPIARRVHGVHNGAYLDHPEEIYANATKDTFGHVIFPQDLRNCTKCHAESTSWKEKPSRITCLACHDSDDAKTHARLNTDIRDPSDPYGPSANETCAICHGAGKEFSADKVHDIATPYVPPYPREKE